MKPKILFLVPYPLNEAPSQRFRFEQYFALLTEHGFELEVKSFFGPAEWRVFYGNGQIGKKTFFLLKGFIRRLFHLVKASRADHVFIHRELAPLGPPILEFIVAKIFGRRLIYDFDDAIWLTDRTNESALVTWIKCRSKVRSIIQWSYKISCGNQYLCQYATSFNDRVVMNPTTVDTESYHNPDRLKKNEKDLVTIGWTGSHSTTKYLPMLESVLGRLLEEHRDVQISVIADKEPALKIPYVFHRWSETTEVNDLYQFDIGIMPLPDDEWAKGKCGFKALQYMALKIPACVSPVGVNNMIVQNGVNGFLCESESDWYDSLRKLIMDVDLRKKLGARARQTVIESYSVKSNAGTFLSLFDRS
jgi:glycosyltransferase involved in cell wall biosynthesis